MDSSAPLPTEPMGLAGDEGIWYSRTEAASLQVSRE